MSDTDFLTWPFFEDRHRDFAHRLQDWASRHLHANGTTHAEVGAYLLGLWGLPDPIVEAVAWHHNPGGCPGKAFTPLTAVHAADAIVRTDRALGSA